MAALNDWDVVDANNNATPPDGWPENTMAYSEVNDTGRAVQGTVRRFWGDSNGSLNAAGIANAYTLTLNEAYSAYFDGMWFACQIPASNTGASTINVNGIGVQSIRARDGSELTSGTLDAGGIYEFRYDGVNFQLMGTLGSEVGVGQATLTNSNAVDLVDTNVALRTGATDPDSAQHLEMTLSELQSKSNATTAAGLDLNPLGGNVNVGAQSGSGVVDLYANGNPILETNNFGIKLSGVTGNDTGVDAAADTGQAAIFLARNADQGGTNFKVNATTGAMEIFQTDVAGNEEDLWISGNRNAAVELYYNNNLRFSTAAGGVQVEQELFVVQTGDAGLDLNRGAQSWELFVNASSELVLRDGTNVDTMYTITGGVNGIHDFAIDSKRELLLVPNTCRIYGDSGDIRLEWVERLGDNRNGLLTFAGSAWVMRSEVDGTDILIQGTSSGSALRSLIVCNPDDNIALFDEGIQVARTIPAALGGWEVNNTLTGGGFERVLTTGDLGVNPTKKVMDGFLTTTISKTTTALTVISGDFQFIARSDAQGDRFRGQAVLFSNNLTTAGTNPGLRLRYSSSLSESILQTFGRLESTRDASIQSLNARPDSTVTGIDVDTGGISKIVHEFAYTPIGNSGIYNYQWAQNVASANSTTLYLGTNCQVFDYGS